MAKNLEGFIDMLRDEKRFNEYGPCLALLDTGNIEGLIRYANKVGYTFTKEDVENFLTVREQPDIESSNELLCHWKEKCCQ